MENEYTQNEMYENVRKLLDKYPSFYILNSVDIKHISNTCEKYTESMESYLELKAILEKFDNFKSLQTTVSQDEYINFIHGIKENSQNDCSVYEFILKSNFHEKLKLSFFTEALKGKTINEIVDIFENPSLYEHVKFTDDLKEILNNIAKSSFFVEHNKDSNIGEFIKNLISCDDENSPSNYYKLELISEMINLYLREKTYEENIEKLKEIFSKKTESLVLNGFSNGCLIL